MDDDPSLAHLHPNTTIMAPRVTVVVSKKSCDEHWHCQITYDKELFFKHTKEERYETLRKALPLYFDKFKFVDDTKMSWLAEQKTICPMHYGKVSLLGDALYTTSPHTGSNLNFGVASASKTVALLKKHQFNYKAMLEEFQGFIIPEMNALTAISV